PNDNSTLRNILNVDDSNANDSNELLFPETIIQLTQNLEKYLSFLRENLSDSNTFPVLQFYREHTNNLASIFAFISLRDNEKTKLNFFKEKIMEIETACKKQTEGARFYHFNDFFHTEMLLLFAIENDIFVSDFNFGALKGTGNIHMCSFNEMCPKCEGLFGRYLSSRPGQRFFVSYINQQSNQKTRTFTQNTQIIEPLGNFFKFDISSEPSSLKKLNRLPCKVNPPLKQPSPHKK
ncbi:MAG: hypothetical protein LBI77_01865, partial [Puniceicoccales bacterium]|nr:hypothetical protein [Puniceicoccales bacterium]